MSVRMLGQMTMADALVSHCGKGSKWLEDIGKMIDWPALAVVLKDINGAAEGAPGYPPLVLLKMSLLQQWYCLSDEGIEAAVDDRLSFRRFCGLPLDAAAPDHSTLWRFREKLGQLGLAERVFGEIARQIEAKGMLVKRGTLIDATIIAAAVKPPSGDSGELSDRDVEAGWTKKNGESTYGYKVHAAVDQGSGLFRKALTTSADLHDAPMTPELVMGDEQEVYGDKGYDGKAQRGCIEASGATPRIMYKAHRNRSLKPWQIWFNKACAPIRAGVERGFATMKCRYGLWRMRYIGLRRNAAHVHLIVTAINLKKMLALAKTQAKYA